MALPCPQPTYIFRGHGSQINATVFIRRNTRLVTGDAEGWLVIWDLATKRPTAVWRAHQASILGINDWEYDKIITHGRDDTLIVWKLNDDDEMSMSTILPADVSLEPRRQPWLLYLLNVNTINFCSFTFTHLLAENKSAEILIAVPNSMNSETVDIYHLPSSTKLYTVSPSSFFKGGMVMCISLFFHPESNNLIAIMAFESGHTSINELIDSSWRVRYFAKPHSQPILSLAVAPNKNYYLTSGADAIIAQHIIPCSRPNLTDTMVLENLEKEKLTKTISTKHSGQQGLQIRNDGKIFATAGWDGRVRVYKCNTMREIAVLKWHHEGCHTVAFTDIYSSSDKENNPMDYKKDKSVPVHTSSDMNLVKQDLTENQIIKAESALSSREKRIWKAHSTHWIAVGSKDGKVSLWEIY